MPSATYTNHEFKSASDLLNDIAMNLTKEPICAFTRDIKDRSVIQKIYFGHSSVAEPFQRSPVVEGDPSCLTQHVTDLDKITPEQKDLLTRLTDNKEEVVIKFGNFAVSMFRTYTYENNVYQMLNIELCAY